MERPGLIRRLWWYAQARYWWYRYPEAEDRDYQLYMAECEVREWWRDHVYMNAGCRCGVRAIFGRWYGEHTPKCMEDDVPF